MNEPAQISLPDLQLRKKNTVQVLTGCKEAKPLDDGYSLRYPASGAWQKTLGTFAATWSKSAPQMTFEITEESSSSSYWLTIRGPEGTKLFVEGARHMLMSDITPPDTFQFRARHAARYATSPLRVLPNYLIIGAKKCGTTELYSYLTQHPAVAPALKKEINYFDALYSMNRNWYRSFFPTVFERSRIQKAAGQPFMTGEATPDYLFDTDAIARIHETIPGVRMLAILRNPIDRAYSHYNHNLRAGLESLSFVEAMEAEQERVSEDSELYFFHKTNLGYAQRSTYINQLEDWAKVFDKSQFCVLKSEDLYEFPERTLTRAFEFLGLNYVAPREFKKLNTAPYPDMDPEVRARFAAHFQADNERLYEFLGEDFGWS